MTAYIFARLAQTILLLIVMSFLIYGLIGLMPGDPIDLMVQADPNLTPEDAQRLKALYGLDRPLVARWLAWLQNGLAGDFGYSRLYGGPVFEVLWPRLVNTLLLMGASFILALLVAVPAGIVAALNPRSPVDYAVNTLAFAGFSMPVFWMALLLIILFAVQLGWLPAGGVSSPEGGGALDRLRYLVLPTLTLSLLGIGSFLRFVRSSMIETMRERFVLTARAKGLPVRQVVWRHALGHAMLPVITLVALQFGNLFSGALVVETVFAYLGMGKLIYDAILGNDYNLALVALLLATAVTLLANLVADVCYAWLDPRITYGR